MSFGPWENLSYFQFYPIIGSPTFDLWCIGAAILSFCCETSLNPFFIIKILDPPVQNLVWCADYKPGRWRLLVAHCSLSSPWGRDCSSHHGRDEFATTPCPRVPVTSNLPFSSGTSGWNLKSLPNSWDDKVWYGVGLLVLTLHINFG